MTAFLFVSDLDNTLIGDDAGLEALNTQLHQHRENYGTKIIYATGRSLTLYRQLLTEKPMMTPDALIAAVGTELYFDPQNETTPDDQWSQVLTEGWNRETIVAIAGHFSDLTPQTDSEQGAFKVSYHLREQVAPEVIPRLQSALSDEGLEVKIIYSAGVDLDVLPKNADKGLAVQHLRKRWEMEKIPTVVCGDSGNDVALYSVPHTKGVIVGNAQPELKKWYEDNQSDEYYFAQADCAGGILEGLKHFNFLEK